jgi:hypothetical protein
MTLAPAAQARGQAVGTWQLQSPAAGTPTMTMRAEECCNGGLRLIYTVPIPGQPAMQMTIESRMDGSDAPVMVGGQATGQSMSIRRIDDRHMVGVVKVNGVPSQTSTATISADGRTLTVESETSAAPGQPAVRTTEVWLRQ